MASAYNTAMTLWTLDSGLSVEEAQGLYDSIAHELAEKIRKELPETTKESVGFWTIRTVPTARQAADLIDPEVK